MPQPPETLPAASQRYDNVAIAFHWLVVVLVVGTFFVGLYMSGLPFSIQRVKLFNWHKWAGMTILGLTILRLLWRLSHTPPPIPVSPLQERIARAGHGLMYLLCLAIPVVGWAYSSAAGLQIVVYGVLPMPNLLPTDPELAKAIKPWHAWLAYALAAMVLLHGSAVLKHQFVDRDGLLKRMLPGRRRRHEIPSQPPRRSR